MGFLKKNWLKLTMMTFTLVGAILFIVLLAQYSDSQHNSLTHPLLPEALEDPNNATSYLFAHVAGLIFFLLAFVFIAMSIFRTTKLYSKFVLCSIGLLCTALMLVSVFSALASENSSLARSVMAGDHDETITMAVTAEVRNRVLEGMFDTGGPLASGGEAFALRPLLRNLPVSEWIDRLVDAGIPNAQETGETLVEGFNTTVTEFVEEMAPAQIREAKNTASYQFFSRVVTLASQLIIFGLLPLAWAIKKIFSTKKETTL